MLRSVRASDGALFFDVGRKVDARGAWTCASRACLSRALDQGAFARAFEAPVLVDKAAYLDRVAALLDEALTEALGLCRRAGVLAPGRTEVRDARARGELAFVLHASDLAERSREGEPDALSAPTMERMGQAVGRGPTGVIGVTGRGSVVENARRAALTRARFLGEVPLGEPASTERPARAESEGSSTSKGAAVPPCETLDQGV